MDNAATSLTPKQVVCAEKEYYEKYNANIHRGVHKLSQAASQHYESVYGKIARLINAKPNEIIFTKNTTEGINLIARGLKFKKGDKIVTTSLEHHSNFLPWLRLKNKGAELEIVNPDTDGIFDVSSFEKAIDKHTKIVTVTHVSNVLGSILPVKEIGEIARENDALFLIDAAQSVPHMNVDVKSINCDALAFSGHKMLGPTGVGVLYINEEVVNEISPLAIGGGSIDDVSLTDYKLTSPPERFEAGTPPIAQVIGLGASVDYLNEISFDAIEKHEKKLTAKALNGLHEIKNIETYGPCANKRIGVIPFNISNLNPHDAAAILSDQNIMVRSGHHCCLPLMKEILKKPEGVIRASIYIYNTEEEIEKFVSVIEEIAQELG